MWLPALLEILVLWLVWFYPFAFRAPHNQKRQSITALTPTRIGLAFECLGIFIASSFRVPETSPPGILQMAAALILGVACCILSWTAVTHLGKQFRVHAGLYVDHELVRTGPYGIVRHPIYASLFGMMICTIILITRWQWAIVAVVLFIIGTEIRVQTEERLLAGRFGTQLEDYKKSVSAYIPFIR